MSCFARFCCRRRVESSAVRHGMRFRYTDYLYVTACFCRVRWCHGLGFHGVDGRAFDKSMPSGGCGVLLLRWYYAPLGYIYGAFLSSSLCTAHSVRLSIAPFSGCLVVKKHNLQKIMRYKGSGRRGLPAPPAFGCSTALRVRWTRNLMRDVKRVYCGNFLTYCGRCDWFISRRRGAGKVEYFARIRTGKKQYLLAQKIGNSTNLTALIGDGWGQSPSRMQSTHRLELNRSARRR